MDQNVDAINLRVLILTPTGRDSALIAGALDSHAIATRVCENASEFTAELATGVGVGIVAEEALTNGSVEIIANAIAAQPAWSDLPIVVLTAEGRQNDADPLLLRTIAALGNVTLLERPVRTITLLHAVSSAMRARRRQYEIRDHLGERMRMEEELRRSNEDLRQFAYAAGHDLKEPLRTIGSYMQLLQRKYQGKLDSDADEYLALGVEGVARMNRLITDLLSYAQLGTRAIAFEAVNTTDVLLWTRMNLQPLITETEAEITHDQLPVIQSDQSQLLQLFQNLIGNALKYRSTERPRVHVSARREGNEWIITVADNGIGFDQQYSERIFGVFKRLHGREVPGTGIGLALCRRIMEKHGGRIWAESESGKGSQFHMAFPVRETASAAVG